MTNRLAMVVIACVQVVALGMVACDLPTDQIDRAIDVIENARRTFQEQSDQWRDELRKAANGLEFARLDSLRKIRDDLEDFRNHLPKAFVDTGDCAAKFYAASAGERFERYLSYLKALKRGEKPVLPKSVVATCTTSPRVLTPGPAGAHALFVIRGFGLRSVLGGEVDGDPRYWLQLVKDNGSVEDVKDPTLITINDPYNMTVNLTGKHIASTVRRIRVVRHSDSDGEILDMGAVTLGTLPQLGVEVTMNQSVESTHPVAIVTAPPGSVLLSGGCETQFSDNDQIHALGWSYPMSSSGEAGKANQWVCAARQHAYPSPGKLVAYAVTVPESQIAANDIKVFEAVGTPATQSVVSVSVDSSYEIVGGGCQAVAVSQDQWRPDLGNVDFGPMLTGSFPSGSSGWTCTGKVGVRQGEGQYRAGAIKAYAIGIKSGTVRRLEPITDVSNGIGSFVYATSALERDVAFNQQHSANRALVGGGCQVTDEGNGGLFLTKSYPVDGIGVRRGWKCAFGKNGTAGTGKAKAVAIAVVPQGAVGSGR